MKRVVLFSLVILAGVFGLAGCASISRDAHYAKLAREHDFEYFFPKDNFARQFNSIDEAYDYVNMAASKFSRTVRYLSAEKGLGAKLEGPPVAAGADAPVTIICWMRARDSNNKNIDLSNTDKPLDTVLQQQLDDAYLVFIVFFNGRAVSLPKWYLDKSKYSGYTSGNAQIEEFELGENIYKATYPVGWGIEKAFTYLKGEIN